jgi:predicted GIY-YIG superfamily endonuclease
LVVRQAHHESGGRVTRRILREPDQVFLPFVRVSARNLNTSISVRPELVEGRPHATLVVMAFHAYILLCADGSFYTGHTDHLENRIADHQCGRFAGYTAKRRPVRLMWSEDFPTRYEALAVERQIKGWSRAKKQALIDGDWERVSKLARNLHAR